MLSRKQRRRIKKFWIAHRLTICFGGWLVFLFLIEAVWWFMYLNLFFIALTLMFNKGENDGED